MAKGATLPTDPEMRRLLLASRAAGWPDEITGSGHWRINTPQGKPVYVPATPSDWRSVHNCEAELKRAGLELDRQDKVRKTGLGSARRAISAHIPRRTNFKPQKFAEALIGEMKKRSINQEELADLCGVSGGSISLWRRCMGRPSQETMVQIQRRLGWHDYYGTPPPPEPEPVPEPVAVAVEPELEPEPEELAAQELPQPPLDPRQLLLAPQTLTQPDPTYEDQMPYVRALGALNQLASDNRRRLDENQRLLRLVTDLREEVRARDRIIAELKSRDRQPQHNGSSSVLRGVKVQVGV